jgi:hypothetical protein
VRTSILGCSVLLLVVSACAHVPSGPLAGWDGVIPARCPVSNPNLKPAIRPGLYVLQTVDDAKPEDVSISYAFIIFVSHGTATVQNFVGPIRKEDWAGFYNALGVLGSTRPGGFWCDGVLEASDGGVETKVGYTPGRGPHYEPPLSRCPDNPHAFLAVPDTGERLASGPKTPSPPPPDITGFVQVVDQQPGITLGPAPQPRGMLASLNTYLEAPPEQGCTKDDSNPALKEIRTYVERALEATKVFTPGLK